MIRIISATICLLCTILLSQCGTKKTVQQENTPAISDISENDTPASPRRGVPAYPDTIFFQMPDSYVLEIFLRGDERQHFAKTVDGYRLLLNDEGYYEYALILAGEFRLSGIIAKNKRDRTQDEKSFLQSLTDDR